MFIDTTTTTPGTCTCRADGTEAVTPSGQSSNMNPSVTPAKKAKRGHEMTSLHPCNTPHSPSRAPTRNSVTPGLIFSGPPGGPLEDELGHAQHPRHLVAKETAKHSLGVLVARESRSASEGLLKPSARQNEPEGGPKTARSRGGFRLGVLRGAPLCHATPKWEVVPCPMTRSRTRSPTH